VTDRTLLVRIREVKNANAILPNKRIAKTLMQISEIHIGNRVDWQNIIDSL